MQTLNRNSIRTLNALNKVKLEFNKGVIAKDEDHAAFIVKSEYGLPQLSTKISFMNIKNILVPIANDNQALIEVAFKTVKDGFQTLRVTDKTYLEIEKAV